MRRTVAVLARRATASRERAVDAVAAAGLTIFMVIINGHLHPTAGGRAIGPFAYVLTVAAGAAMVWCRHRPRVAFGVVTVALGCYVGRGYPNGPVLATGWLALLALSLRTDRRSALTGGGALCVVLGVAGLVREGTTPLPLFFIGWSAAAVFLGDALRNRRAYLCELEERVRDVERTREEEARRRVAEDRLRIARDLHDSVAHAMATINVQAGAAAHVVDRRPEAAKTAFVAIQRASGEVLDELTGMLRLLRDTGAADRAPAPKIDQIVHLVEATRDSGLRVRLHVDGPTGTMPGSVATAAYRIVQESLTNVIRHAGGEERVRDGGRRARSQPPGRSLRRRHGHLPGHYRDRCWDPRHAGEGRVDGRAPAGRSRTVWRLRRTGHVGGQAMIRVLLADDQPLVDLAGSC